MLGAGDLGAMEEFYLFPALTQLLHHCVEMPPQVTYIVVAIRKIHIYKEVAFTHPRNLALQFLHGPMNDDCQHHEENRTDAHCPGNSHGQNTIAYWILQGKRNQHK